MICANVLPRQHTKIPWGWKNQTIDSLICGKETYVIEPKGELTMPDLPSYFDWSTYTVEGHPVWTPFGTRNMKSIFTTATRLLGFERLLIEQPDLTPVAEQFMAWNYELLYYWAGTMEIFFLGDDFAGNQGMFMSPDVWRRWLKPHYAEMFKLAKGLTRIFHSDGDIFDVLDDLIEIGADVISYEPVGRMNQINDSLADRFKGTKFILVEDQAQTHANSMALQR